MTAGLFLGLLLFLSFFLWIFIRQRQENVLNSAVIAATNCSVLVTDAALPHHPIVYVNPAFLLLTGYGEKEVIGQRTSILTGPNTDRGSMEKLAMALQDGWACRVRLCHYRKNGTSFWNDVSLSPVKDRLGRVTSIVWTMSEVSQREEVREASDGTQYQDIVARQQAEQAFRDSEARQDLALVVDRKKADVHRLAPARMEAISTFAGGIAHELNNGLTAVLGFSELALPLIPAESKTHRHIRQVIAAAKKSRELIQQLLAFGGQNDQGRCQLSFHSLAKESLRFLRPTIPLWIELRAQIAHTTNPISANAVQMHEMIFCLIDSALRTMRQTGGTLEVQLQNREFVTDQIMPVGRLAAGWYVCLSVRDTGEGMDPERLNRLVGSLLMPEAISEEQGVGLGVVYGIVTTHGGTLTVESQVGVGTTVSVYLPAFPASGPSTTQKDDSVPHGHESILFVDDEDSVVRFGREVLESLGYFPVVCRTAAEAWELFQAEPKRFDLLITDRAMSGMSGDRLARECRRLRPDLPIIVCSGSNGVSGLDDTCSQDATEYLLKPLTLHELAYAIRRALAQSPAHPECTDASPNLGPRPSRISIEVSDAVGPRG